MTVLVTSRDLLRRLGTVPGTGTDGAPAAGPRLPFEARTFDTLLAEARAGTARRGAPPVIDPDAALTAPLDEDALGRLGAAIDRATALGARRAVALVDGRALVVETGDRRVVGELDPARPGAPEPVDVAVQAAPAAGMPAPLPPPGALPPPGLQGADPATDHRRRAS
ncbi:MAG: hypothetical protein KF817_12850 [Phycisphaeraceae bacterium]|nr:hypothetical protein [Phycisphaeraceae bacterium]